MNWHRAYQGLLQAHGKQARAIAEYDAALKAEPQNGRLLYLRGRIDADFDARNRYYVQSETAEPDLPWPWYATAAETASQGNWAECLRNIDKATERKLDPLMVRGLRHLARMGVGDFNRLEQEYRVELAKQPLDASTLINLCDVLAAEGQAEQARQALREFERRTAALNYPNIAAAIKGLRMAILYTIGDFEALSATLPTLPFRLRRSIRPKRCFAPASRMPRPRPNALAKQWDDPWNAMLLSVAFRGTSRPTKPSIGRARPSKRSATKGPTKRPPPIASRPRRCRA